MQVTGKALNCLSLHGAYIFFCGDPLF